MIPRDEALRIYRASIDRLATLAKELEVDLLIEPNVVEARNLVDGRNALLLLADADEIERFMCDLARPEVGILLDTGHTNVTMATLGASRDAFIERISPWIRGLHVHDNDGSADQHRAPAPTSWVMDLLRDPRFSRLPIVVEATFRDVRSLADYYAGLLTEIGIQ